MKAFIFIIFTFFTFQLMSKPCNIAYKVSFPKPSNHYAHIEMTVWGFSESIITAKLPVWTPGSYLVREFSKNVEGVVVKNGLGKEIPHSKSDKNAWKINVSGQKEITISYDVYCFELSVRTSFVEDEQAFLNGANIFMYIEGSQSASSVISFFPDDNWKEISTSLKIQASNKWTRFAANYDELVDSPILISTHPIIKFKAAGIPHEIAIQGISNMDEKKLVSDLTKIIEEELKLFGGTHPCKKYLFIIHNTEKQGGGLEHLNSSANMIPRFNYGFRDKYLAGVSLLAHEYFHLWNAKRIRPIELGPFNYGEENYTKLLWVVEGFTSYYDNYLVHKGGVSSKAEYLDLLELDLNKQINAFGERVQSVTESSFDTWIKYYRPNENSNNTTVSYYTKGSLISLCLNFILLDATNGAKSLDDVMRALWAQYLKNPTIGYTEADVLKTFEKVGGIKLKDFFENYIYKAGEIDYNKYFNLVGYELVDKNEQTEKLALGLNYKISDGKMWITEVLRGQPAYEAGLSVNDELIAIDGFRIGDDLSKFVINKKEGDSFKILVNRSGLLKEIELVLLKDSKKEMNIVAIESASEKQLKLRKIWLP